MGRIIYVMGKSASGKDTIYRELRSCFPELRPLVPYTTRPKREGEIEGREYCFTDDAGIRSFEKDGRLIEKRVYKTQAGDWTYATVDDGSFSPDSAADLIGIGTLESYLKVRAYYGAECMVPVYIEVENGERIIRAVERERKQKTPRYDELCRRFLADEADFSEEKLREAGIEKHYVNAELSDCIAEIVKDVI